MMKKNFLALVILALLGSACGGGSHEFPFRLAEGLDSSNDAVESECSYFYFMWGRTAELDGKLEEAREAYEKALVCDLHAVHIMRRLAVLLINMDKKEAAAGWIKVIVDENPDDLSSHAFLANLYASMDEFDQAEAVYLSVLEKSPRDYDNMLQLGALYARQKKYDAAIKTLEKLIKLNPESFVAYHYLARIYIATEKFDKARSSFEKALEINWSPVLAFEAAVFLEKSGRRDEALKLYRQILADDEANEQVRTMIISLLLRLNRIDEAIDEMEELLVYAADPLKAELNLSRLLLDRQRYDEAIKHLENVLDQDPEFNDARILLAAVYHDKGDAAAAKISLAKVTPESDDYENATIFLVRILGDEKKYEEAIRLLRERLSAEKTRRKGFYPALALLLRDQRETGEAVKVFREAMTRYPDDKDLLLAYALFQDEQDDVVGALATMGQVLRISPDEPYALNYMSYTWAERGENLETALEYVERAIALKPDDGFVRDSLGWVLFKLGRFDEALRELRKSLEMEGDDPTINEHLGDVYRRLGKMKKALAAWNRALTLQPDAKKKSRIRKKIEAAGK
jgi:tetratricopeptide (TPR) repeat protein